MHTLSRWKAIITSLVRAEIHDHVELGQDEPYSPSKKRKAGAMSPNVSFDSPEVCFVASHRARKFLTLQFV